MQARWYLPALGRFISADTLVPDPANPQGYNRYSYVENRPLNLFDPSGHRGCTPQEAAIDFETCDQNLGAGDSYGNVNLFNDAFPYVFLQFLLLALEGGIDITLLPNGESLFDAIMRFANEDTANYIANAFGNNALAGGMAEVFGGDYRQARPSDFLGQNVTFLIAAGYFADGERMGNLGILLGKLTPTGMPCSFSANTLVMTDDGLIPISQVTLETIVLAYNEETGEIGYYPVIATWSHEDPVVLYLTIDGETIITTPNHPFFTYESEWIQAGDLQVGDEIRNAAWDISTVEIITFTATPQTMYNFTVGTAHTYFVGEGQWLVHNECPPAASSHTVGSRRLQPDPNAAGPHTTFRRDGTAGEINHYATWSPNSRHPSGFDLELRVDIVGSPHFNKATGTYVPTPHVHSNSIPGGVGPAAQWQIPLRR